MIDHDATLHEALASLGWFSRPSPVHSCRLVFDDACALVGTMTASATWALLRERGLVLSEAGMDRLLDDVLASKEAP